MSQLLYLQKLAIFKKSLRNNVFSETTKRANIVPVHKKGDKILVKKYGPISLLQIFGKIFERVIYNSLFNYFINNKLHLPIQFFFQGTHVLPNYHQ